MISSLRSAARTACTPLLILLAIFLMAQGCARGAKAGQSAPEEKVSVKMTLNKAVYRPGEAVIATVALVNATSDDLVAAKLNAKTVIFVFGRPNDPERMERQAVASDRERMDEVLTLSPGRAERRDFVLTRLSEFSGPLLVQAHYLPGGKLAAASGPKLYSNTAACKVAGARVLKRDPEGYILKDEAIRLAQAAAKGEAGSAQAIFVRDEAGFYKWYVNLKPQGKAGLTGWLVDPYLGQLWHKARPFDPVLARDPRFERPAGLPRTQVPARAARQLK